MNRDRLLQRFLQYVRLDTMANGGTDEYPSSPGQIELGKLVVEHLQEIGASDISQDKHGIVMATIPATAEGIPTVAFNAHLDTSPETTAANVKPQIIDNYAGGDIPLTGDTSKVITVKKCAELADLKGKTLITTDGTTLLGGDDKAGMAIMMELGNYLLENPGIEHGPVRLLFTCDEEIGRGTLHCDIDKIDSTVCYTFDGGGENDVDIETFSADLAVIEISGINIHPAIAKDKMVNGLRIAGEFLARLPREVSPECTEGRDGFMHPYSIEGGVASVEIQIILRSFESAQLEVYANQLRELAKEVAAEFPSCEIDVKTSRQYRNLGDGLKNEPRAVEYAVEAHKRLGREAKLGIIRGGTDGSQFTEKGLPTPNLSSGQHNIHSPLEFACLDEMLAACEVGLEIVKVWAEKR